MQQAGKWFYAEATNDDWEKLSAMMFAGKLFIAEYSAELILNDNMPVGFEAAYLADYDVFELAYDAFMKKTEQKEELSSDKIEANNSIYKLLMEMFFDGQHIFRKNAAIRERFTFVKVKELVSSSIIGGTVLKVFEGTLLAMALINLGALPTGAKRLRVTVVSGGPLEFGLSVDGTTFNGNTVTLGGIGTESVLIVDLNTIGELVLLLNQNANVDCVYKVVILG